MKVDKIYTEESSGGELYEIRMKTIPLQDNKPKRKLKKLEGLRDSHTKAPHNSGSQ